MAHFQTTIFFLVATVVALAGSTVPQDKQFTFVNSGDLGDYIVEYGADYRAISAVAAETGNFQMVFFNTTPNAFELAIRMGNYHYAETMRFVWSANRNRLVADGATLKFGADGNLVLTDSDGTTVWSTGTAGKGVVGLKLHNDGNLVLYDGQNKTVWQSFDSPTDSLLVGQSLRIDGVRRLVSRVSDKIGSEGLYSLAMEAGGLVLYDSTAPSEPLPYWTLSFYDQDIKDLYSITRACKNPVGEVTFLSDSDNSTGYPQLVQMRLANVSASSNQTDSALCKYTNDGTATYTFNTPRFPTTLSFLRVDSDGNLRFYTYSPEIELNTWDVTYERYGCGRASACDLPGKCGSLGVCNEGQCVACPRSPDGFLLGWSSECSAPKLPSCSGYNSSKLGFYDIVGAEHFSLKYSAGRKMMLDKCRKECLKDCKCAAFFYWKESSRCFLTPTVRTLRQLGNSSHIAYVKTPLSS